jgi:hypothetical protein
MVELMRDRQQRGLKRLSVFRASERVAEHLAEYFPGAGHLPTAETVRRYHKEFERVMCRGGDEAELALRLLANARNRRELAGWRTDTYALVIDPAALAALGYEVRQLNC